jgi:hypothetical protein
MDFLHPVVVRLFSTDGSSRHEKSPEIAFENPKSKLFSFYVILA